MNDKEYASRLSMKRAYRTEQRRMGELTVATRLINDFLRGYEEDQSGVSIVGLLLDLSKKQQAKLRSMEREAGCAWGDV